MREKRQVISSQKVALVREFAAAGKMMKAGDPAGWRAWLEAVKRAHTLGETDLPPRPLAQKGRCPPSIS